MRAVVYARVSTREQAEEGYSIAAQTEACRRIAQEKGWTVVEEYVDRGESARTADRPQFREMLERVKEDGSVKYLIVHKLDRLARNLEDHAQVRALLRRAGVTLVSVTESLEDSASGKLVEGILASINEFYSANLSQEIKKGIAQKVKEGGWPTHAPIGYRNVRITTAGRRGQAQLAPDDQAGLVVKAFELYASGHYSFAALAEKLVGMGMKSARGGHLTKSGLCDMLKNPVYIGKVVWKGIEYDGIHEPLVSKELFDKVQAMISSKSTGGERSWKHDSYLKGTLFCGECNSRMIYHLKKGGRFGYFTCVNVSAYRKPCSQKKYVPLSYLEKRMEALYRRIRVPEGLKAELERQLEEEVTGREMHRAEATRFLAKRLDQLARQRDRLLKGYMAGAVELADYKREKERIDSDIAAIEVEMGAQTASLARTREIVDLALSYAEDCAESYAKASEPTKRLFNRAFFKKVFVKDGKVVRWIYEEPFATLLANPLGSNKKSFVEVSGRRWNRELPLFDLVRALGAAS